MNVIDKATSRIKVLSNNTIGLASTKPTPLWSKTISIIFWKGSNTAKQRPAQKDWEHWEIPVHPNLLEKQKSLSRKTIDNTGLI